MDDRGKKPKKPKASDTQDRISNLPDVLLTHILSFVRTKDAVRTSALSTRWKPLWACVPVLDLRDSQFPPKGSALIDRDRRKSNFLTFLYCFLMQNNRSSVRKFRLQCEECYDYSQIESWICAVKSPHLEEVLLNIYTFLSPATDLPSQNRRSDLSLSYKCLDTLLQQDTSLPTGKICIQGSYLEDPSILDSLFSFCKDWNGVKELEFGSRNNGFNWDETYNFPQRLFPWGMLVVLKLRECVDLDFPKDTICFPNLKVLHLENNRFKYSDSASNLINSSCPVLEELEICRGDFEQLQCFAIASLTIKLLKIIFLDCHDYKLPFETLIDVPAVEHLDLQDDWTEKFVLGDFSSVVEATIRVKKTQYAVELLRKIVNVKQLFLYESVSVLVGIDLPVFHYLTHLEFRVYDDVFELEWPLILEFLNMSPTLEYLSFEGTEFVVGEEFDLTSEHDVPHCLLSSLKICEFGSLYGKTNEIKVIGYFLKNSKLLRLMIIRPDYGRHGKNVNLQAISVLPRGSNACKICYERS